MTIDLAQPNIYFIALMPLIVAGVAGIIRQDRLPQMVNEVISVIVALLLASGQALLGGKLGGSPFADFGIVSAYTISLLHSAPFQKLQQGIQTNVASVGKPAPVPVTPPQILINTEQVVQRLLASLDTNTLALQLVQALPIPTIATMLKNELIQAGKVVPSSQIPNLPTQDVPAIQPIPISIRTNSPPGQGG